MKTGTSATFLEQLLKLLKEILHKELNTKVIFTNVFEGEVAPGKESKLKQIECSKKNRSMLFS